jgi:hypothetical protein
MKETRELAAIFAQGDPVKKVQKARITAVNAGPPKTLSVLIEDRWPATVRYSDTIGAVAPALAVDQEVMVLLYGSGKRFAFCRLA